MQARGMSQSDLARKLDQSEHLRGQRVASRRYLVSKWLRGVALPDSNSMRELAKALDIEPGQLLPASIQTVIEDDSPSHIREIKGYPDMPWVYVNEMRPVEHAQKIFVLIAEAQREMKEGKHKRGK